MKGCITNRQDDRFREMLCYGMAEVYFYRTFFFFFYLPFFLFRLGVFGENHFKEHTGAAKQHISFFFFGYIFYLVYFLFL